MLKKHLTPPTFIALLALIFALTGASFAADRISGDADLVTVRVNYRWGSPVIGRY